MTENKLALLMLKDTIDGLSEEDQNRIHGYADQLRDVMTNAKESGEEDEAMSQLAISLVGIETAVELGQ